MQTLVAEILAAWRRAERLASEFAVDSPEHAAASAASERLRQAYHALTTSGVAHEVSEAEARVLLAELTLHDAST